MDLSFDNTNKKSLLRYLTLALVSLFLLSYICADTPITSCETILDESDSGTYYLTQNMDCNSDNENFIKGDSIADTYNITLDFNNYTVDWNGSSYFAYADWWNGANYLFLKNGTILSTKTIVYNYFWGDSFSSVYLDDMNIIAKTSSIRSVIYGAVYIDNCDLNLSNIGNRVYIENSRIDTNTSGGWVTYDDSNITINETIYIGSFYSWLRNSVITASNDDVNFNTINMSAINNNEINGFNMNISGNISSIDNNFNDCNINIIDANNNYFNNSYLYNSIIKNSNIYDSNIYDSNLYSCFINDANFNNINLYDLNIEDPDNNVYYFDYDLNIENILISDSNIFTLEADVLNIDFSLNNIYFDLNINTHQNIDWNKFYYKIVDNDINKSTSGLSDLNYSDFNTNNIDFNIDISDTNVEDIRFLFYTYTDVNNNTYDPFIPLTGYMWLKFITEDTTTINIPDLVTFDGVDITSDINISSGRVLVNFDSSDDNEHILIVTKKNYGTRTFNLILNDSENYDYNIGILDNISGQEINFEFWDELAENKLNSAYVMVFIDNNELVGARQLDSSASGTFFLNGNEEDYNFHIYYDSSVFYYGAQPLTIKIPLDEKSTSTTITPFDVDITGIGSQAFDAKIADFNVLLITNTLDTYNIQISDPDEDYYSRTYNVIIQGNPSVQTLQPYLIDVNGGLPSFFHVRNKLNNVPLPEVTIEIYKKIGGGVIELVESIITDSTGTGAAVLYTLDNYELKFYFEGDLINQPYMNPAKIEASTSDYYVYIVTDITTVITTQNFIYISINNNAAFNYKTDLNEYNIDININGAGIGIINNIITNDGNILIDMNYTGVAYSSGGLFDYNLRDANIDTYKPIVACVYIYDINNSLVKTTCNSMTAVDRTSNWNPFAHLMLFFEDQSDFAKGLFVILIMLIVVAAVATVNRSPMALYIIGSSVIGIFLIMGFFNPMMTTLITTAVALGFIFLLARKGEGSI